jgi:hypothetical protein
MTDSVGQERGATRTKMSNTIAEKQKNKPGIAGEAISYYGIRILGRAKRWDREGDEMENSGRSAWEWVPN